MSTNLQTLDPHEQLRAEAAEDARRGGDKKILEAAVRKVYRLIDDNLHSVGGLETAAGMVGLNAGDLRRALDHRGRYLPVDHAMAIAQRMRWHNASISTEINAAIVLPSDLLVWPIVQVTFEDEARMLRDQLARFGDAGREAASAVPRGRR